MASKYPLRNANAQTGKALVITARWWISYPVYNNYRQDKTGQ